MSNPRSRVPRPRELPGRALPRGVAPLLTLLAAVAPGLTQEPPREEQVPGPEIPLFSSQDPLTLTLRADFDALDDDRSQETQDRPGTLLAEAPGGEWMELPVGVRTRGNFRLRRSTCSFPPLRLDFDKDSLGGTVFQGQNRIKLVTHCRDGEDDEQNLLQEFLVYRIHGLLTDASFQVRLARVTYEDTSGERQPVTRFAFFLEDDDAVAARLGGRRLEVAQAHPAQFDGEAAARMALFQYMVGNTDWSMPYFHNVEVIRTADGRHLPVPYDFDWTGLVNAPYARPDPSLPIRTVRDRLYRGFCRADVDFGALFTEFRDAREAVMALVREQAGLAGDSEEEVLDYLEDFYEMLESEGRARQVVEGSCRRMP